MSKKDEAALEAVLQYLVQQNRPYSAQVVLWIRDILVRIRIRGSLHLLPDPDPAFFVSGL